MMIYNRFGKQSRKKYGIAFILFFSLLLTTLYGCGSPAQTSGPAAGDITASAAADNITPAAITDKTEDQSALGRKAGNAGTTEKENSGSAEQENTGEAGQENSGSAEQENTGAAEQENSGSAENENTGDDRKVPAENDKSTDILVEVIPSLDEFVWTISIDDKFEKTLESELGNIKAVYHLKLTAVKNGGKTADGQYKCTAVQDMQIDTSDMDREIEQETSGTVQSKNSIQSEIKTCTFDVTKYSSIDYNILVMQKEELPKAQITPYSKMALGKFTFSTNASSSKSLTTEDGTGTGSGSVNKKNHEVPFKIGITNDGNLDLIIVGEGSNGQLSFKGRITNKPIRP